jgi:hypothetical protein
MVCLLHDASTAYCNSVSTKTTRTGAFIRLLRETDKGYPAAAVSCS